MRAHTAAAFVIASLIAASAEAQIMSGQINQPRGRRSDPPTLPLDTNVGTSRPTFRVSVTRVEVSAVVVDAQGEAVRDLRAEDFEVIDGGRKQKVLAFVPWHHDSSAIPLNTLPAEDALAAATATNGSPQTSNDRCAWRRPTVRSSASQQRHAR
jgi:hypothetical protein